MRLKSGPRTPPGVPGWQAWIFYLLTWLAVCLSAWLVGGDDVFHSLVERNGTWERMTRSLGQRLHGLSGVGMPLMRGVFTRVRLPPDNAALIAYW